MPAQSFPWVLTRIGKLSRPQISRLSQDYLRTESQLAHIGDPVANRKSTLESCRLLVRLLTEMQLKGIVALAQVVGQDYLAGNALAVLLAESWRTGAQSLQGNFDGELRPVTVRAMARSFNRPYETMRRALHRLSDLELILLNEDGASLIPQIVKRADVQAYLITMHDIAVTLMDDVFCFAKMPLPTFPTGGDPSHALILAALDLHLLGAEGLDSLLADWTGLMLIAAITAGNIRHITYDPELAFVYASATSIPPMELRRPVYFKSLCDTLPVCPTTAWRRVTVLKMLGALKTVDGGLVNDSRWFSNTSVVNKTCDMVDRMCHIISRVPLDTSGGFAPEKLYIRGAVPPINI